MQEGQEEVEVDTYSDGLEMKIRAEAPRQIINQISELATLKTSKEKIQKLNQLFPYVQSYQKIDLHTSSANLQGIIQNIRNVAFPNLRSLNLRNTSIITIEGIQKIYMPLLKELNLEDNSLASVEPLRKIHLPNVQRFEVTNVLSNCGICMTYIQFHRKMDVFHLDCLPDPVTIQDVRFIAKIDSNFIDTIRIMGMERINQTKVHGALKRRWENIDVRVHSRFN